MIKKLLITVFLLSFASSAFGTTYYISTTGNDSTGDGSNGTPWRTLSKAGTVATGGDTVIVKNGTYTDADSDDDVDQWAGVGSAGNWITVQAETAGSVIFDGQSNTDLYGILFSAGSQYTRFEGLRVTGCKTTGFHMNPDATGITDIYIYNCQIDTIARTTFEEGYGRSAIFTGSYSRNVTVDRCLFYDDGRNPGGIGDQNDYVHDHNWYAQGAGHIAKNCIFYNIYGGWAIKIDGHLGSFTGSTHQIINCSFGGDTNTFNYSNITYHGGHITIYNNYAGYGGGIQSHPSGVVIANNVFHDPPVSIYGGPYDNFAIQCYNMPNPSILSSTSILNNVTNADDLVKFPPTYDSTDCQAYNNNHDGTTDAGILNTDLGMTDPDNNDFTLTDTATYLIGTGNATYAPSEDYLGTSRPIGSVDDIGAYEYTNPVYNVSPVDGATGVSIDAVITWSTGAATVDLWFDEGECSAVTDCDGSPDSDDDADGTYDPGTLTVSTDYCIGFNAGVSCQEFDFQTSAGPPVDSSVFGSIAHSTAAGDVVHSVAAGDLVSP